MPITVKFQVIINQRGLAPNGEPLDPQSVGIHFDHRPPLHERIYDPNLDETVPPANDAGFIVALPIPVHRNLSRADISRIRKTERQRAAEQEFQERLHDKEPGKKRRLLGSIRSRPLKRNETDLDCV
jgi:hypothetical protein